MKMIIFAAQKENGLLCGHIRAQDVSIDLGISILKGKTAAGNYCEIISCDSQQMASTEINKKEIFEITTVLKGMAIMLIVTGKQIGRAHV